MKSNRVTYALVFTAGIMVAWGLGSLTSGEAAAQKSEGSDADVASSEDERFFMLNALWFKPDDGAKKYEQYMAAAGPFVAKHGGKSEGAYAPEANIIGEFDADLVFFVEWPNQKAFTDFIAEPGYQAISHLREEAIRDSLLIRCKRL